MGKHIKYSKELKIKIVKEYNKGDCSVIGLVDKYNIHDRARIYDWVKQYNEGNKTFKETRGSGNSSPGRPKTKFKSDKEELEYLRMENDILKSLASLE